MAKKEQKKEKSYLENITNKIGEIATHYGFTVIKPPQITPSDLSRAKHFKEFDHYGDAHEKVNLTQWYINERLDQETQPIAIHYKKPVLPGVKKNLGLEMYCFEIMGSSRPTSEALILKCALSILEELGYKDLFVDINSIGDKESMQNLKRD